MENPPSSQPLPTYAEEVLESLKSEIEATANGLPRDQAETYLDTTGFEPATIETALDQLLNNGYIYIVNDQIRLTDSDS
jgi:DNA-binding PadR family transcriptional regulator